MSTDDLSMLLDAVFYLDLMETKTRDKIRWKGRYDFRGNKFQTNTDFFDVHVQPDTDALSDRSTYNEAGPKLTHEDGLAIGCSSCENYHADLHQLAFLWKRWLAPQIGEDL